MILALGGGIAAVCEVLARNVGKFRLLPGPLRLAVYPAINKIVTVRASLIDNWRLIVPGALVTLFVLVLLYRRLFLLWHNQIVPKIAGNEPQKQDNQFPRKDFDLQTCLANTPQGLYFLGLDQGGEPVYLTEWDLNTHGHIMGHTGSGKTKSVLEPLMLQDLACGKGLLFMDAKGSSENVARLKELALLTNRTSELKIFAPAYPEWSHSYNPIFLGENGDPDAAAERIFSVFPLEHEYYKGQSWRYFKSLVRLLAGTGKPFNLTDVRIAGIDYAIRSEIYSQSSDKRAQLEIESQRRELGKKALETFTGLFNALCEYDHPLLSSYSPDIVIDDIMNSHGVMYFTLPANRYPILAPAIGKIVLQHVRSVGSLRQIDRKRYDQTPFAVNIDEFSVFCDDNIVKSLAMLRDANVQFRLAHQSLGDLEAVSKEFTMRVKDNTRWKVFLFQNDADHIEKISRSFGTYTTFKRTVRYTLGPLWTFLNTGEVSNREVEEFILHPNALKSLAQSGQGYLLLPNKCTGVNFAMLPEFALGDYLLPRNDNGDGLNLMRLFEGQSVPHRQPKKTTKRKNGNNSLPPPLTD